MYSEQIFLSNSSGGLYDSDIICILVWYLTGDVT